MKIKNFENINLLNAASLVMLHEMHNELFVHKKERELYFMYNSLMNKNFDLNEETDKSNIDNSYDESKELFYRILVRYSDYTNFRGDIKVLKNVLLLRSIISIMMLIYNSNIDSAIYSRVSPTISKYNSIIDSINDKKYIDKYNILKAYHNANALMKRVLNCHRLSQGYIRKIILSPLLEFSIESDEEINNNIDLLSAF